MGVDFLVCTHCEDTFPDCGPYIRCNEDCYLKWCSESCAEADGLKRDEDDYGSQKTFKYCRRETVRDYELLTFLLDRDKLTKEEAIKLCLENEIGES